MLWIARLKLELELGYAELAWQNRQNLTAFCLWNKSYSLAVPRIIIHP